MIGICTDSHSLLPRELATRFGVEVVPLTISVDGVEYLEGVDLDADRFYGLYSDQHAPVATSGEPSSGQFAAAYDVLIGRGCTEILSIHSSTAFATSLNAPRLAAHCAPVPVRLIDCGALGFGVSCCLWAAAEAIERGAPLEEAASIAESLASRVSYVFITAGLQLVNTTSVDDAISVWKFVDNKIELVGEAGTMVDAVNCMASWALSRGPNLRVGVGTAHRDCLPIGEALFHAVGESSSVLDVVPYRILPSAGIAMGPGTVSCVTFTP
jgi:fatty acid kinase fatty acid binding subunit